MTQYGMTGQEALDVITAGMQAGLDKSGEFTDNLAEYTPLFKQAGFTSGEMLNILKNGLDAGAYNLDYVNDLVKEFGIRVQDGSKVYPMHLVECHKKRKTCGKNLKLGNVLLLKCSKRSLLN
ncbi:phage tail tape measure protein [Bacillus pacificus]